MRGVGALPFHLPAEQGLRQRLQGVYLTASTLVLFALTHGS